MAMNSEWSFDTETRHSALVHRIISLLKEEPFVRALADDTCPSDPKGQVSFILDKGKAVIFYKELLTLFSIRLQQDVSSMSRRSDLAKAERRYGKRLHNLTRRLNDLVKKNPEQLLHASSATGWKDFIAGKIATRERLNGQLATQKKQEKAYRKKYFELTASIHTKEISAKGSHVIPREARKKAWLEENQAWENISCDLDGIFDGLVRIRQDIATALGFSNYSQLLEKKQKTEGLACPLVKEISASCRVLLREVHQRRKELLGIARLRPYDINTRTIKGFEGAADWCSKTSALLQHVHPTLSDVFQSIISEGLHDVEPRKGKASASFCLQLPYSKKPYIFMSLHGGRKDVMTGIHEVGHALHIQLAFQTFDTFFNYKINPATSEFFALTLELLALRHLHAYYADEATSAWAIEKHIENLFNSFLTFDTIHKFESVLYRDTPSASKRKEHFAAIISDNIGLLDYSGYEKTLGLWAYRIPLLVSSPGYFSYYVRPQLMALFFFDRVRKGVFSVDDFISLIKTKGNANINVLCEEIHFRACPESIDSAFGTLADMAHQQGNIPQIQP